MLSIVNTISAAKELANHFGWAVFPINPKTKTPYFCGWQETASSILEKIEKSFTGLPYAAIGICTGKASNLVCIDIDERPQYSGLLNYQNAGFDKPDTLVAKTPSGGIHLYFKQSALTVPNSVSLIANGVDVRGEGGYIISPPSDTVFGSYRWECSINTLMKGPCKLPKNLERAINNPGRGFRKKRGVSSLANQIKTPILEGNRNHQIARRCGLLLRNYDADQAWEMVKIINRECCEPPLDNRELSTTFHSIRKREGK